MSSWAGANGRPRLQLLPRSKPMGQTNDEEGAKRSSIFGSGKPREDVAKETEGRSDNSRSHRALHDRSSRTNSITGKNTAIRRAWHQVDMQQDTASELSTSLEQLYSRLSSIEVGTLFDSSNQTLIENVAGTIAKFRDHKDWISAEARLAGCVLLRLEQEEILGNAPPVEYQTYLNVINAYAKVVDEDETAAYRAENVLDHMERRADEGGRPDLRPDRLSLNTLTGAFAKARASTSPKLAERILDQMERDFAAGDMSMRPTTRTYGKVIDAYAREGDAEGALRTLRRQEEQYEGGNAAARPNTISYTGVIDALAKSASQRRSAASDAESLLRSMLVKHDKGDHAFKPDAAAFSATLDAWAKSRSRDAPQRSLDLFDLMNDYGIEADIIAHNIVLNTLALSEDSYFLKKIDYILLSIERNPNLKADSFTYNAALKGMGPHDSERFLRRWEFDYKKGATDERPDSLSYCAVMKSWAATNIEGFEEKVLEILDWMEENNVVGMNRVPYNEALRALSRSLKPSAGPRSDKVYERLITRYEATRDPENRPDKFTHFYIVGCWCRTAEADGSAIEAEKKLREMAENPDVCNPDCRLINQVLTAWTRSCNINAAEHCEGLIAFMELLGLEIDTVNYNTLIGAYKHCQDGNAGKKALRVLTAIRNKGLSPTSVTYKVLVQACDLDDEREDLIERIFEDCCDEGMLDSLAYREFCQKGSEFLRDKLGANFADVPAQWTRNANRGPATKSIASVKMKRGYTGRGNVKSWGWAR